MQTVTIDLIPQNEKPIVKLSQYDNDRQVRFMLEENGETYTLTGAETVEVNIRKPDRNIVVIAPTIDANAYVDVLFTEQSAACFGESFGELSIKSGDTVIGTCNFIIDVEISPIYGGIDSATEINNLETQIEEIVTEVLADDYYTKTETNDLLDAKADASDVYTKTQTDTLLSAKADASDVYTKTEVDNIILDIMPVDTASGPIASFETNIVAPLQEVKCSINPIQNGTPWIDSNEVNKEPYIKRAVAGTATRIGNHLYDKLVGGTVAFNQLLQNGNFATINGWSFNSGTGAVANNKLTFTITEAAASNSIYHSLETKVIQGHKYFVSAVVTPSKDAIIQSRVGNAVAPAISISANTRTNIKDIIVGDDSETTMFMIYCNRQVLMTVGDTCVYENVFCIDLTQMFGSTIADYIYGLEQATAGAGVAFFRNLFPNDYYAYNAGELMSVKATAHVMKNASNTVIGNYALDSNLELRGIPKLVNNKLEYDGDTYESNGDVTRRYNIVALDTLAWTYISDAKWIQSFVIPDSVNSVAAGMPNAISNINVNLADRQALGQTDLGYTIYAGRVYIRGVNLSEAELRALTVGKYLVYEKAEPATEQASPFTNPQVCDENGTEEYTDSRAVAIPVGHETYQANICPISGYTEANITANGSTYTIAFGQTVYGGVLDVTRGKLKPCIEYPSYNGETLSGRWLSSEATYVESTTPPIGSQVVSLDDYGTDIDLTPEVISAVVGTNNVYSDTNGNTTVQFKDSIQHYIDNH